MIARTLAEFGAREIDGMRVQASFVIEQKGDKVEAPSRTFGGNLRLVYGGTLRLSNESLR